MSTTAVFVEILVSGITASIWIALLLCRIIFPYDNIIDKVLSIMNSVTPSNALFFLLIFYNIGWVSHYLSEKTLDPIFQNKSRRKIFKDDNEFYRIRSNLFQKGSNSILEDIKFDRHLLRISRSNTLNFFLIGVFTLLYLEFNVKMYAVLSICSFFVSVMSFNQWRDRYIATFKKFKQLHDALGVEHKVKELQLDITKK